jgi:hypothetical protein
MVFNATFNNISVISWQLVLLVEETGVLGEKVVIKFVCGFLLVLRFPPPIKLTAMI